MKLLNLRKQIDRLDKSIVASLSERAKIILKVAKLKQGNGGGVYAPAREQEVLRAVAALNRGPMTNAQLKSVYREIMSVSLALEKNITIAYLGPEASFSHLAARKRFGSQVRCVGCNSIADVFLEVERGSAEYGVVPIENSIEGAVSHTLDMFVESDLKICAQVILDVSHNLLGVSALRQVKRIYSNPYVFGQCRLWLQKHAPHAQLIEVASTSKAAEIARRERASACIASLLAASVYGLKVLARDIEDSPHNVTRFFVIGETVTPRTGHDKTSLMFSIKDKVGALHEILLPFKKYKLNLTKIESRPSKKRAWEYYFFVDLVGHTDDARVRKALVALDSKCAFLKVLGSYPVGE